MPSKKPLVHTKKSCGAEYEIQYTENNIPYLACSGCEHRIMDWVKWEESYKNYWQDEEKWALKKEHIICLLGWFCHLYAEHYGVAFSLSLCDRGLFRGAESHLIRKIYATLDSDALLTKEYFQWFFINKVIKKKRKLTSLSLLATPAIIQEFRLAHKRSQIVGRSTPLPPKMLVWVDKFVPTLKEHVSLRDFGELHTLLTYYSNGHYRDVQPIVKFIDKLMDTGYITPSFKISNWSD